LKNCFWCSGLASEQTYVRARSLVFIFASVVRLFSNPSHPSHIASISPLSLSLSFSRLFSSSWDERQLITCRDGATVGLDWLHSTPAGTALAPLAPILVWVPCEDERGLRPSQYRAKKEGGLQNEMQA
jgi:hypothetical protein